MEQFSSPILSSFSDASPTNPIQPVFIQRDLPPAPYAYGMQDFDSSEEVTIVKRAGQTVYTPTSTTHLTTPQALPTPLAQVQTATPPQPLQVPLVASLSHEHQVPIPLLQFQRRWQVRILECEDRKSSTKSSLLSRDILNDPRCVCLLSTRRRKRFCSYGKTMHTITC